MKKLYCNQYTDEIFDTEEKALASEREYLEVQEAKKKAEAERKAALEKKNSERAAKAKEVEEALKAYNEARKNYQQKLGEFCRTYGAFHTSIKDVNPLDLVDAMFDLM